jgi:membrane protease subunit HflK
VNEAQGYANEVLPRARAEANEYLESAQAYAEEKVAKADGESKRFLALVGEYKRAPEVTRQRLYLEAMEEVLTDVELVVMEPGGSPIMPYLPLGQRGGQARVEARDEAEKKTP